MKINVLSMLCLLLLIVVRVDCQNARLNDFYGNSINVKPSLDFSADNSSEVLNIINNILDVIGLSKNFEISATESIDNCKADIINNVNYLFYNKNFLNSTNGLSFSEGNLRKDKTNWKVVAILAHEIGHISNNHISVIKIGAKSNRAVELEADEFAGGVLQKLGATLLQAQEAMYLTDILEEGSINHPGRAERLAAIERGYRKSERLNPRQVVKKPAALDVKTKINEGKSESDIKKASSTVRKFIAGDDESVGKDEKGRTIYEGPRGDRYFIKSNGNKTYISKPKF